MIDVSEQVFEAVKSRLLIDFPKLPEGLGFDENNIVSLETPKAMPTGAFDFVSVSCSDNSQQGTVILHAKDIGANVTFTINIYSKDVQDTESHRVKAQKRARQILSCINDCMNEMGFKRLRPMESSNHNDVGIYRISVNYYRLVRADDIL